MAAFALNFPAERNVVAFDPTPLTRMELCALLRRTFDLADALVARLDEVDGDSDLEGAGDDEPSLASPVGGESQVPWAAGSDSDREIA